MSEALDLRDDPAGSALAALAAMLTEAAERRRLRVVAEVDDGE